MGAKDDFIESLKAAMDEQEIDPEVLADRLGCTPQNVYQHLDFGRDMRISTAEKLAGALGMRLEVRLVEAEQRSFRFSTWEG
jgi:hypothetical protein